jgi:hypothetical protein
MSDMNPTFEIYVFMLIFWQAIDRLDSVRQLHELLVKVFGATRIGDQKRIEKICQRIGLSFRKVGRPKKKNSDACLVCLSVFLRLTL